MVTPYILNQHTEILPRYTGGVRNVRYCGLLKNKRNQDWVVDNLNVQDWGITDICIQDWDADGNNRIQDSNICCPCNLNWNAIEGLSVLSRNVDILTMVPLRSLCTFCTRLLQIIIFRLYNLMVVLGDIAMRTYTCITPFIPCREWWPPYIY